MVRRGLLDLASADRQLCPSTPAVPPLAPPFEGREGCADIFEAASALDQLLQQKAAAPPAGEPDWTWIAFTSRAHLPLTALSACIVQPQKGQTDALIA